MTIAPPAPPAPSPARTRPAELTDRELQWHVTSAEAECVKAPVDPDEWFPIASEPAKAASQASRALALCTGCAVRAECLELALRQWRGVGRYGIWGGTLESERHALRQQWLAGADVRQLLRQVPGEPGRVREAAASNATTVGGPPGSGIRVETGTAAP
jgi:WhiB family redox-sensing transcriptional regulator